MSTKAERKKREVEIGLANNAFGAAAGTVATVQARNAWKRAKSAGTLPNTRIGRLVSRSKISPGKAIAIAGGLNVAGQAANGLLDAQSAQYFARERIGMSKKPVAKGATMHRIEDAGNGHGSRIVEPVAKAEDKPRSNKGSRDAFLGGAGAAGAATLAQNQARGRIIRSLAWRTDPSKASIAVARHATPVKLAGLGVMAATAPSLVAGKLRDRQDKGGVKKARRFDPEADRQRRLGAYSGLAAGGALVLGDRAVREVGSTTVSGTVKDKATGGTKTVRTRHVGFKPGRGRRGALLAAGAGGLAALSAASYKRGISERNRPWA